MNFKDKIKKLLPYIISCLISLGVGILSALITSGNMDIYDSITKPPLAPPAILFPIVWTALYILMGISSAKIYIGREQNLSESKDALAVYAMSLAVNFTWSILFFNLGAFLVSFVWLLLLLSLIITTVIRYYPLDRPAALLQIPYIVWVAFAGYLNFAIFILNG